jgi:hypothetical protein
VVGLVSSAHDQRMGDARELYQQGRDTVQRFGAGPGRKEGAYWLPLLSGQKKIDVEINIFPTARRAGQGP